ncbi:MAG: DUF86 domain-containing protein [Chloroflexi bacterium]|nr:DUF86 domain-containing protein [Chloroflexota bacterium]
MSDYQRIISFRNVLAHGYDVISNRIVWDIIQNDCPFCARNYRRLSVKPVWINAR